MKKRVFVFLWICLLGIACSSDDYPVPNVKFSIDVYLDLPQEGINPFIIRPGGQYRVVGINGVVVYELSKTEFYAYDLMCTHDHDGGKRYFIEIVEEGEVELECPECGSKFNVVAGGVASNGPAQLPLRKYQTSVTGSVLRIWN